MTWEIRHGDGLLGMQALGPESVDHVITDPPYSPRVHGRLGLEQRTDGSGARDALTFSEITDETIERLAHEAGRLCRRWCLIFTDEITLPTWVEALEGAGLEYVRRGLWVKTDAMPQMSGDRPGVGAEDIVIAHATRRGKPMRKRWHGGGRPAVWRGPSREPGIERSHPCQKPIWLMEALLRDFTEPGELILDPFAGSGTTGVAAVRHGRRFLGWELQEKYADAARRRIAATQEQMTLGLVAEPA